MTPKQEKWQSFDGRLSRLRLKVVLAAVFAVCFLFFVPWFASKSFKNIIASVETLSTPRTETGLVNNMITDISEIQAYSSEYSISKNPTSLQNYQTKTVHVRSLIDSLKSKSGTEVYAEKLDTLRYVFEEYVSSLDEWISLRTADSDISENKMYGLIKSSDSSLKHTSQFLPKAEVRSVTKTVEKPKIVEVAQPEKKKINRFKKNQKQVQTTLKDTIREEVTTEITTTKVDSSYLYKVDTLLGQMKQTLTNAEKKRSGFRKKMSQRETELHERELVLMAKIRTLLDGIESEEMALTKTSIDLSKITAEKSYRQLIILGIIAICVMIILVVTLFSDISKSLFYRKKLQEAKQEAERLAMVKEEFLANMSHEIRTPLNSIIGFSEQLQESELQPGHKAKVHAVLRSSNHLLSLVNDILDFSKLEAGSLQLEKIGFCYTDVIEEVIEMTEPEARRKNVVIVFEPNIASETMVTGDPVRVKQILLNLVSNAVKFTEVGSINISTEIKQNRHTSWITCQVKDSGKGIQPSELDKIFRKFEQEDNSITRHHGGTGLGLSISKKITELQGGKIWVESEPEKGSTFFFEIPFISAEKNDYKDMSIHVDYIPGLLNGKNILVIDDDPMVPEILKPLFDAEKINALFYQDPLMALEVICKQAFDVVFVDLHMPNINGLDMLDKIRNDKKSQNKTTYTILCTANVIKNFETQVNKRIPDCVLYKPYRRRDILNTLYKIFNIGTENTHPINRQTSQTMIAEFTLKNFQEFAGNDIGLLDNFITLFISESEGELGKLDSYLANKNYKQIGEVAHMFKNTYGQLEAKEELSIIKQLEGLVKDNDISEDEIKRLITELQEKSKVLFVKLQKEMESLKNG